MVHNTNNVDIQYSWKLFLLLLLGIYVGAARCITQNGPKFGSLWDFEKVTNKQVHASNTTTNTIAGIGHWILKIFNWSSGTSNFVLFVVNEAIILYLVIKHRMDNETKVRKKDRRDKIAPLIPGTKPTRGGNISEKPTGAL